jgi:hypothetical protein
MSDNRLGNMLSYSDKATIVVKVVVAIQAIVVVVANEQKLPLLNSSLTF